MDEMEKSSCIQLTREDYELLKAVAGHQTVLLEKAASTMERLGVDYSEAKRILESGEYRIVD